LEDHTVTSREPFARDGLPLERTRGGASSGENAISTLSMKGLEPLLEQAIKIHVDLSH